MVNTKKRTSRCESISFFSLPSRCGYCLPGPSNPRSNSCNSLNNAALSLLRGLPRSCTTTSNASSSAANSRCTILIRRFTRLRSTDRGAAFLPTINPSRGPSPALGNARAKKHLLPDRRPPARTASNCAALVRRIDRALLLLLQTADLIKR